MLKRMTLALTVSLATAALFGCGDDHPGKKAKHEAKPVAAESASAATSVDATAQPVDATADTASVPPVTNVVAPPTAGEPTFGPGPGLDPANSPEIQHMRDVRAQQAQAAFQLQQQQAMAKAAAAAPQHPSAKKDH